MTDINGTQLCDAASLIANSKRFDLIPKVLLASDVVQLGRPSTAHKDLYLRSIQAFNGFWEDSPRKTTSSNFLDAFTALIASMQSIGFQTSGDPDRTVYLGREGEPLNGAHRIAAAAALGLRVPVRVREGASVPWDWAYFHKHDLRERDSDYIACQFVHISPDAQVLLVQPCVPRSLDLEISRILSMRCKIYYQKEIFVDFHTFLNLKYINYARSNAVESWAGNHANDFAGLRVHAESSYGANPLRAYVLIATESDLIRAKSEIRRLVGKGNFAAHSADSRSEVLELAQVLFHRESLDLLRNRSLLKPDLAVDAAIERLHSLVEQTGQTPQSFMVGGSATMALYGLRAANDVDVLGLRDATQASGVGVTSHESELMFYPSALDELLRSPQSYLWFRGFRFASLQLVYDFKSKRREFPKDVRDMLLIESFQQRDQSGRRALVALRLKSVQERTLRAQIGFRRFARRARNQLRVVTRIAEKGMRRL